MIHADYTEPFLQGIGTEIGAFDSPIPDIDPIYIDKFSEFAGVKCLADYPGDAVSLPFYDDSLDYVASSHVIEHLANPVRALAEWQRVLKPGGYAYAVVPDRRFTFDSKRDLTTPEHMIEDYFTDKDDTDTTHIDDFVFGIDWNSISPGLSPEEATEQKSANAEYHHGECQAGREINIHFHVFESSNFVGLIDACAESRDIPFCMRVVQIVEEFPDPVRNGFLAILQKPRKPKRRIKGFRNRLRQKGLLAPNYPIDTSIVGSFR